MRIFQLVLAVILLISACKNKPTSENQTASSGPEIGLQLYSLRNQFKEDVPGTLALIKEFGIHEVEGGGTYGYPMDEFKNMLADNELEVVSVGVNFHLMEVDSLQSTIDEAKAFGAKFVMCAWVPHPGDTFGLEQARHAVEVFNRAGKTFADNGLSFCYHPHGYEFGVHEDGTFLDYIIKNTNRAWVNFEMDVFWVKHPGHDPVALLKKYPDRFLMMHLKDRKPGTPDSQDGHADVETNVVLGSGDVGIAAIMEQAQINGVRHYFIEDESSRVVEQIPQSLEYLKSLSK